MQLIWFVIALLAGPSPVLTRPAHVVTDNAGVLTRSDISRLEQKVAEMQKRGLAQTVVYIAPAMPPGARLEDLTLRSANAWGIGDRGLNNGLIIFVFVKEHLARIEVGKGLESAISNDAASRVMTNQIIPAFRRGAYGEGLLSALNQLSELIAAQQKSQPGTRHTQAPA